MQGTTIISIVHEAEKNITYYLLPITFYAGIVKKLTLAIPLLPLPGCVA